MNHKELFQLNGPVLVAANHPNSFLDAIILCTLFNRPVYSLARGDAFNNTFFSKILFRLKLLPVYRVSEGTENLEENYKTFETCRNIFKQNGIVLIFTEGRCINEWHLRPLKKGTARLAISCWDDGIPVKILPLGINYSSFQKFGKNLQLFFGAFITANDINLNDTDGKRIQSVNTNLLQQLQPFVHEIKKNNRQQLQQTFAVDQSLLKKTALFIPSLAGWLLHAPLYFPIKKFVKKAAFHTDHYDSIMVVLLLLVYPIYLLLITLVVLLFTKEWFALLLLLIIPFTAWAHVQLKKQLD